MLTPAQIQTLQSTQANKTGGASNTQPMTPDQVAAWAAPETTKVTPTLDSAGDTIKNTFSNTIDGAKQTVEGVKQLIAGEKAGDINQGSEGAIKAGAGVINTVISPLTNVISAVAKLPVISDALGGVDKATQWLGDKIGNNPTLQKFAVANPNAPEIFSNLLTIAMTALGGEKAPEIKSAVSTAADTAASTVKKVTDAVTPKDVTGSETISKQSDNSNYQKSLSDAQNSIYPKLTPSEAKTVTTKEVSGITGKKSVPDLINHPTTKPVIESVANMPEDIKVKPSDTITVKEDKLNQGISRLHQDTSNYLQKPEVKAQTKFKPSDYQDHMKTNVLDPIKKEYGTKSVEYSEAQKAIKTSQSLIKENNAYGVHDARQSFQKQFEADNQGAFKKAKQSFGTQLDPKTNATIEAGRAVRNEMRNFTQDTLPKNSPYRARLTEEHNLIIARDEMRNRTSSEMGKGSITRAIDKNPVLKKVVQIGTRSASTAAGLHL